MYEAPDTEGFMTLSTSRIVRSLLNLRCTESTTTNFITVVHASTRKVGWSQGPERARAHQRDAYLYDGKAWASWKKTKFDEDVNRNK